MDPNKQTPEQAQVVGDAIREIARCPYCGDRIARLQSRLEGAQQLSHERELRARAAEIRAEAAEAKLARVQQVIAQGGHCPVGGRCHVAGLIEEILGIKGERANG